MKELNVLEVSYVSGGTVLLDQAGLDKIRKQAGLDALRLSAIPLVVALAAGGIASPLTGWAIVFFGATGYNFSAAWDILS